MAELFITPRTTVLSLMARLPRKQKVEVYNDSAMAFKVACEDESIPKEDLDKRWERLQMMARFIAMDVLE